MDQLRATGYAGLGDRPQDLFDQFAHQPVALHVRMRGTREQVWRRQRHHPGSWHRGLGQRPVRVGEFRKIPRELRRSEERIRIEPADEGVRTNAHRSHQRPEDILPAQQPIRKEIETGITLDRDPAVEVLLVRGVNLRLVGAAPVLAASRGDYLLGPRVEAVLIGKNLDRLSVSTCGFAMV